MLCETCFLCVYASVSALRKPDRTEFSLASSNLSMSALLLLPHTDIYERFLRCAASVC